MLKRLNEGLPGLVWGILLYGVIIQFAGVWFVEDQWGYSIGLWYGIAIAVGMAVHMAMVIYDAVTFDGEDGAQKRVAAKSILRYVVVAVLFGILCYFHFGNLFMAFIGVMGLKVSAYVQPLFIKVVNKIKGSDDAAFEEENSENLKEEVTL